MYAYYAGSTSRLFERSLCCYLPGTQSCQRFSTWLSSLCCWVTSVIVQVLPVFFSEWWCEATCCCSCYGLFLGACELLGDGVHRESIALNENFFYLWWCFLLAQSAESEIIKQSKLDCLGFLCLEFQVAPLFLDLTYRHPCAAETWPYNRNATGRVPSS